MNTATPPISASLHVRADVVPAPPRGTVAVLLVTATLTVMASAIIAPSLPGTEAEFSDVAHADLLVCLVLTLPALSSPWPPHRAAGLPDAVRAGPPLSTGHRTTLWNADPSPHDAAPAPRSTARLTTVLHPHHAGAHAWGWCSNV